MPQARVDRDKIEKDFLKNRREGFQRFNAAQIDRPFDQVAFANAAYCPPEQRFDVDFSIQSKIERQRRIDAKNAQIEKLRNSRQSRSHDRIFSMEKEFNNTEQRFEHMRDTRARCKKNMSGISGYNPVSMTYANTREGDALRQKDSRTMERAQMRSERLFSRRNGSYNPITGEQQQMPTSSHQTLSSSSRGGGGGNPLW